MRTSERRRPALRSGTFLPLLTMTCLLLLMGLSSCKEEDEVTVSQIKDIDGNVYTSVTIGTQVWMVENLKVTRYRNGDAISNRTNADDFYDTSSGAYSNDYEGTNKNGRLYNWYAVADPRKLAPEGWHIPSQEEWATLLDFLGGESVAGSKMKQVGASQWCTPNADATNSSGFTALPGDWRVDFGFVTGCGDASWWSSTAATDQNAYNLFVFVDVGEVSWVHNNKNLGIGVRCIKD